MLHKFVYCISIAFSLVSIMALHLPAQEKTTAKLTNMGEVLNSSWADFAPVISADGSTMMFTSTRPVTDKELKSGKATLERIFVSYYNASQQQWSKAVVMPTSVNAAGRNNSAIALSNDAQRLLLYRDDQQGNGDIYESVLTGSTWSEAVRLPEPVNSASHESSATYSPDGNTIFFVSNRKGGMGGRDIWQCKRNPDGSWSTAVPLGEPVNTREDEEGVYLHPDGVTLYFSSKAHGSIGGYDVMYTTRKDGKWSVPQSMGPGVNSKEHDVFLVMEASGQKGYYASAKAGGKGAEDIYLVEFIREEQQKGPKLTLLKGVITDAATKAALEADIELTDNATGERITTLKSNAESGRYLVSLPAGRNYGISVSARGYLFHSVNVSMPDTADYNEVVKDIALEKMEVGTTITLNNIFYDFDKSSLRNESLTELDKLFGLLNQNPSMQVEIRSHTDNRGSEDYNVRLSQARAQSVTDYLSGKGISSARLVAKGYGKSQPIASNDTDEGRQLNRRTEFKILSK